MARNGPHKTADSRRSVPVSSSAARPAQVCYLCAQKTHAGLGAGEEAAFRFRCIHYLSNQLCKMDLPVYVNRWMFPMEEQLHCSASVQFHPFPLPTVLHTGQTPLCPLGPVLSHSHPPSTQPGVGLAFLFVSTDCLAVQSYSKGCVCSATELGRDTNGRAGVLGHLYASYTPAQAQITRHPYVYYSLECLHRESPVKQEIPF